MAELLITLSNGTNLRHPLVESGQTVGRDASCDIPIDDPSTSRRHARFSWNGSGFIVEDLGSKNGTLVNDAPCSPQPLRDGDRILIGSVQAIFYHRVTQSPPSVLISDDGATTHATRYATKDSRLILPQQRLEVIYDLSERLTTLQNQDVLLNDALSICFEMLGFERGAIALKRKDRRTVDWPVVRNLRGLEGELTVSRTLLNRALEHGERAIFTGGEPGSADPTMSIVQQGIRSAMCVPLMHGEQILGVIYGDRQSTRTSYTKEDIDFLAGIARQVSIGLMNWQLLEEQRATARLNHDIDLARTIQTGLFPRSLPNHERLRVAAINDPGQRVSGDYYDAIELPDGRLWCLMADVTGEGVPAALLMSNLQATVRATIEKEDDPGVLLTRWNQLLCQNTSTSRFITCLLALIDPKSKSVKIANAGHHPPILVRPNQPGRILDVDSTVPLGIMADTVVPTVTEAVGSGEFVFFCYTDGVIEAMNADNNPYTSERLYESLSNVHDLNPQALVKQVRKSVSGFVGSAPQSDDITILAARVSG